LEEQQRGQSEIDDWKEEFENWYVDNIPEEEVP